MMIAIAPTEGDKLPKGKRPNNMPEPEDADQAEDQAEGSEGEGMTENEICVPLDSLALPDQGETMTPPEVGDIVQASIEGRVTRIEGDNAYVEMSAVNGHPLEKGGNEMPEGNSPDGEEETNLQNMAQSLDNNPQY